MAAILDKFGSIREKTEKLQTLLYSHACAQTEAYDLLIALNEAENQYLVHGNENIYLTFMGRFPGKIYRGRVK